MSKPPTMLIPHISSAVLSSTPHLPMPSPDCMASPRMLQSTESSSIPRASISVIDSAYANSYLRHLERTTTEPLDIAGSGQLSLTSYLCTSLTFLTGNPWTPAVIAPGVLFLTDNLASKINIGNDILVNAGAFIDLAANTMTFAHRAGVKLIRT